MKTKLEKLKELERFQCGGCTVYNKKCLCPSCIPHNLLLELIDEEEKLIKWRNLS